MAKYDRLVNTIISGSMKGAAGKVICIDAAAGADELVREIAAEIARRGGVPCVNRRDRPRSFDPCNDGGNFINHATEKQFARKVRQEDAILKTYDGHIRIYCDEDLFFGQDIDQARMQAWRKMFMPVWHKRVLDARPWVLLYFPSAARAVQAGMSLKQYTDFWHKVSSMDYSAMDAAMEPLKRRMEKADVVRIVAKNGTDLTFSIKGRRAVKCSAQCNIPDGEVFTAPIRNTIDGVVQFNTDLEYAGIPYKNIRLKFQKGRVVEARSEINNDKLCKLLDGDAGARYAGEFALGVNPYITRCFKDVLFDEKIGGSFHIALGNCHKEAPNGNKSQIHFDMIQIQTPEYGGGEIWFDGELIRKDGKFVLGELKGLDRLK